MIPRIENEDGNYRPLPEEVEIKKSSIEGYGLFAKTDMSHLHLDSKIMRTPLGGFYNHSDAPNCAKVSQTYNDTPGIYYYLKTSEYVKAGEELTVNYTFYNIGNK